MVRQFGAMSQSLRIPIELFVDNIFEGVEVFGLSITNDVGGVEFQFQESDFPSTVINLVDRGKFGNPYIKQKLHPLFIEFVCTMIAIIQTTIISMCSECHCWV